MPNSAKFDSKFQGKTINVEKQACRSLVMVQMEFKALTQDIGYIQSCASP